MPAAKLGLGYGYPGLKRLVDVVGPSFAKEIFFTARQFDAAARRATMGLVNRVVPTDELESLREELRRHDRRQRAADHQGGQVHRRRGGEGRKQARSGALRRTWWTPASPAATYVEGRKAFMEKRKPVFTGTVTPGS